MVEYHIVNVVWGEQFVRLFLNDCLPYQFSPGNLPAIADRARYRIFTTPADAARIATHPTINRLQQILPVDVVPALSEIWPDKYAAMNAAHRQAIADAARTNAALLFLAPDIVVADGAFAAVQARAEAGVRALLIAGYRVDRDAFLVALTKATHGEESIMPRDLVRVSLPYLHPITRGLLWETKHVDTTLPSHLYWQVGSGGLLARCFHLHPLFLAPRKRDLRTAVTIDHDAVERAGLRPGEVQIVDDSDELMLVELSPSFRSVVRPLGRRERIEQVAVWCQARTTTAHRAYAAHPIRYHSADLDQSWTEIEAESGRVVAEILSGCSKPKTRLRAWWLRRGELFGALWARVVPRSVRRRVGPRRAIAALRRRVGR
ncbi:MAG: hypothetical protein U0556_19475 [Dehalococcoidia bacterium]